VFEEDNMILWINGSFGVGKTTISEELNKLIEGSFVYDPEKIGSFLRDNIPSNYNDFQDYELWRVLNFEILKQLVEDYKVVIVPMTMTNKQYYEEIIGKLEKNNIKIKHLILTASKENIFKRLDFREDTTEWSYQQVDRCLQAFENEIIGENISTDNKSIEDIVKEILYII